MPLYIYNASSKISVDHSLTCQGLLFFCVRVTLSVLLGIKLLCLLLQGKEQIAKQHTTALATTAMLLTTVKPRGRDPA